MDRMDNIARNRLDISLRLFKRGRIQKILGAPLKYLSAEILRTVAQTRRNGLPAKAALFSGDSMTVVFPEYVSVALWRYGFYEEGLTKMFLDYLKPGMTFLDVGAHYGYYTLLGSWLVGDTGQVHSFEPTPNSFEVLKINVEQKSNVFINQIAVSQEPGALTINDYGVKFAGHNSLHRGRFDGNELNHINVVKHEVEVTTLDLYTSERGLTPDFVKIDAESAEYEILQGMDELLTKTRPIISVEVGDKDIEGILSSKELVSYISGREYQPYEFTNGQIVKHQASERYDWDNLLFLPK